MAGLAGWWDASGQSIGGARCLYASPIGDYTVTWSVAATMIADGVSSVTTATGLA